MLKLLEICELLAFREEQFAISRGQPGAFAFSMAVPHQKDSKEKEVIHFSVKLQRLGQTSRSTQILVENMDFASSPWTLKEIFQEWHMVACEAQLFSVTVILKHQDLTLTLTPKFSCLTLQMLSFALLVCGVPLILIK